MFLRSKGSKPAIFFRGLEINAAQIPNHWNPWSAGGPKIDGTVFVQAELALFDQDPNGSGESGIRIARDSADGIPVPLFACRNGGTNIVGLKWDIGGFGDGMGSATIADGAIDSVDLASGTLKPWNITVQTIEYTDANGNPASMQALVSPP